MPEDNFFQTRLECLKLAYDLAKTIGDFEPYKWEQKSNKERKKDIESLYDLADMHLEYVLKKDSPHEG